MKKNKTNMLVFIISSFLIVFMSGSLLAQNANPPGLKYIKESELKKIYTPLQTLILMVGRQVL